MAESHVNLNIINNLTEEQIAEFKEAFQIFDKDGNGTISLDEMKNILLKYGSDFTEQDCEEIFKLLDTDGSNGISYAEFADVWKFQ